MTTALAAAIPLLVLVVAAAANWSSFGAIDAGLEMVTDALTGFAC